MPGSWQNIESATKIALAEADTRDITHDLRLTPLKVEILWKQNLIPPGGGTFAFTVAITNRSPKPMSVKTWTSVFGDANEYGMWSAFQPGPVSKAITIAPGEKKSLRGKLLVPSYALDTWYWLPVFVGPSESAPWRVISEGDSWFEKGIRTSLGQEKIKEMIRQKNQPPARIIP